MVEEVGVTVDEERMKPVIIVGKATKEMEGERVVLRERDEKVVLLSAPRLAQYRDTGIG